VVQSQHHLQFFFEAICLLVYVALPAFPGNRGLGFKLQRRRVKPPLDNLWTPSRSARAVGHEMPAWHRSVVREQIEEFGTERHAQSPASRILLLQSVAAAYRRAAQTRSLPPYLDHRFRMQYAELEQQIQAGRSCDQWLDFWMWDLGDYAYDGFETLYTATGRVQVAKVDLDNDETRNIWCALSSEHADSLQGMPHSDDLRGLPEETAEMEDETGFYAAQVVEASRPARHQYFAIGEVGDRRTKQEEWVLVKDGKLGYDIYDFAGTSKHFAVTRLWGHHLNDS
jgi:hypothetical protein